MKINRRQTNTRDHGREAVRSFAIAFIHTECFISTVLCLFYRALSLTHMNHTRAIEQIRSLPSHDQYSCIA